MSFSQTGHSVLSLLVLGLVKTETLGGLGSVSSALVASDLARDLDVRQDHCDDDDDDDDDNDDNDDGDDDDDDDDENDTKYLRDVKHQPMRYQ